MSTDHATVAAGLALAILAVLAVNDAQAGNVRTRYVSANAASFCQTALPVFDGNIRKRPLAVQNEGSSNAFVTCSFTAQGNELTEVSVFATNLTGAEVSLSCTAVTGAVTTANAYVTKTIVIPATGFQGVGWRGVDFGNPGSTIPGFGLFNVSCNLLPGVGITRALVEFTEDVGA